MCAAVATMLGLAMLRGRTASQAAAAYDLDVYADQLKEVDRDLARGVLSADEAARVRTEVSRRILAADAQLHSSTQSENRGAGLAVAVVTGVAVVAGAGALYSQMGAMGYRDVPIKSRIAASDRLRAERLTQADAEARVADIPRTPPPEASADFLALMEDLRATVKDRPDDLRGLMLLARNEASLGRAKEAAIAQGRIIALKGADATAADHAFYADVLITAAAGYVSQEAETSLRTALEMSPRHPIARYYLAQYMVQVDRPDTAFRLMEELLRDSTADAPWLPSLRAQIEEVAWRAGVAFDLPPLERSGGPSASDIAAADDMSPEDRKAMIEGMVGQLSERLATEGGSAEEWARLIRALGVLERF